MCVCVWGGGGGGALCVFIRLYIHVDPREFAKACQSSKWIFRLLWTPVHILAFVDTSSCFGFCGLLFQKEEDAEYVTDKCILFWVVLCVCVSFFF